LVKNVANNSSICDYQLEAVPMAISGYAWGHMVKNGPHQRWDIGFLVTHPQPSLSFGESAKRITSA
jgi:hypothetical protein